MLGKIRINENYFKSLIVLTLFLIQSSADNNQLDKLFEKLLEDGEISARETEMKIWGIWTTHPKIKT